jgi:hypothetical protein
VVALVRPEDAVLTAELADATMELATEEAELRIEDTLVDTLGAAVTVAVGVTLREGLADTLAPPPTTAN